MTSMVIEPDTESSSTSNLGGASKIGTNVIHFRDSRKYLHVIQGKAQNDYLRIGTHTIGLGKGLI